MSIWINFFTVYFSLTCAMVIKIESQDSDLVDLILKVKDFYEARSAIIFANIAEGNMVDETSALDHQKLLSKKTVLSDFIDLEKLNDAINLYYKKTVLPFFVVILRSWEDFEILVNVTHRRSVNNYASLVIFSTDDETLMSVCTYPGDNYFNLNFDARMLVYCQGEDVPVREWYSVYLNETEVTDIAYWKCRNLEMTTNESLHERRNSLKGISLRATAVKNETTADDYSPGYFGQILDVVAQRANFSLELQSTEEIYGIYNPATRKWNGIMAKLVNGETDLALGETTITSSRLSVVDFSKPIVATRAYYYIRKPDVMTLPWSMYYLAFGGLRSRLILMAIILLVPLLISFIKITKIKITNGNRRYTSCDHSIQDCYLEVWTIFCRMPLTKSSSLRLAYFSLKIFTLLIFAVYSAVLTSYLSCLVPLLPFNSVNELIEDGSSKILIIKDTNYVEIFENSASNRISKLRKLLVDNEHLPIYITTAFEELCSGGKFVLFVDKYTVFSNQSSRFCEIVSIDTDQMINIALAFSKNSPYVGFFNFYLEKLRTGGVLQRLANLNARSDMSVQPIYEAISIYNAIPLFAVLATGMILSLIVLMCEYTVYYVPFHRLIKTRKKPKSKKLRSSPQRRKSINEQSRPLNYSPILYPFTN